MAEIDERLFNEKESENMTITFEKRKRKEVAIMK